MVKLLVEVMEPYKGAYTTPAAGQVACSSRRRSSFSRTGGRRDDIAVYGQESNERTWRLAQMNLAIHRINGNLSPWADTFVEDRHPDIKADFILANPPFNISDWGGHRRPPLAVRHPSARNANFAWLQHIIYKLGSRGSAGVVLANGSMSSQQSGEGEIRAALVEADLVLHDRPASPTLPDRPDPGLPVVLRQGQGSPGCQGPAGPPGRDALHRRPQDGHPDRPHRAHLHRRRHRPIAGTYHAWRGTASAKAQGLKYENVPGFCYSATLEDVRKHDHILAPGRYVGAAEVDDGDDEPIAEKIAHLKRELFAHFDESTRREQMSASNWSASMSDAYSEYPR